MDCDISFNKGCDGGNPARAYDYILRNGLSSDATWPYKGHNGECLKPPSTNEQYIDDADGLDGVNTSPAAKWGRLGGAAPPLTVAGIDSFVILPSRNEAWLKQYVGTVGPVSVGICGTDLRFMYYGGGVFNPRDCCTTLNHAVLIVGYGKTPFCLQ